MSQLYRYPGVKPFELADSALFFGRDRDRVDLLDLVNREQLVLLFGKSGYGKSSLVKAGLLPDLLGKPQVRLHDETGEEYTLPNCPVYFRLNLFGKNQQAAMPLENVVQKWREVTGEGDQEAAVNSYLAQNGQADTLWGVFKASKKAASSRVFLIFDQFEEFFSYPPEAQAKFRLQLCELLYTRIPQAVRDGLGDASRDLKARIYQPMEIHTLFSIRSDRMHLLNSMRDELPAILHQRYELKALSEMQAEQAIVRPALLEGAQFVVKQPFQYESAALAKIISELKKGGTNPAEPEQQAQIEAFQLQMVCQTIEQNIIKNTKKAKGVQQTVVQEADLPNFDLVYEQYYTDRLADLPDVTSRKTAHTVLEEEMVIGDDLSDTRRISVDKDLLRETMMHNHQMVLGQDILDYLEDKFLIRRETINGRIHYEVSHDVLLSPLVKSRNETRKATAAIKAEEQRKAAEARAQLAEAEMHKERLAREQADRRRRAARRMAIMAIAGFVLAALLGIWAVRQKLKAEFARQEAQKALVEAEKQRSAANNALKKVVEARKEKLKAQIDLETEAQFLRSASEKLNLLARVDSMERAYVPFSQILSELEK
jgi:energy-coupling factor transporter ATP-binding protein EcfA2